MVATIILALIYFWFVGWLVHGLMGADGGPLHNCFIGGAGVAVGCFLEWITGCYTTTIWGVILLSFICAVLVEWGMRKLKQRFF